MLDNHTWGEILRAFLIAEGPLLIVPLLGAMLFAFTGWIMLDRADRGVLGFVLGFFLGPIGLVIAWVVRDNALRDQARYVSPHAREIDEIMARLRETDANRKLK
jgi:hypothetical protein